MEKLKDERRHLFPTKHRTLNSFSENVLLDLAITPPASYREILISLNKAFY